MDGGEDLHRVRVRVLPGELLVDLEHSGELLPQHLARQVRHVEVDLVLVLAGLGAIDAALLVEALLEQLAARDVARDEVPVAGVLLLEEVVAPALGDVAPGAHLLRVARDPHAPALAAHALRDEAELVGARDGRGMHLDELAVRVAGALLIGLAGGGAGVDDAVRRFAEHDAAAARRERDRVPREGADAHRLEILRDDAAARPVVVDHEAEEVPHLELPHHLLAGHALAPLVLDVDRLPAADLFV